MALGFMVEETFAMPSQMLFEQVAAAEALAALLAGERTQGNPGNTLAASQPL